MTEQLKRFLLTALLLCVVSSTLANELIGHVVGVTDGDTIAVLVNGRENYKIRLSGIDAPEKKQPYGQQSKKRLSDLAYNRMARIEWNKRDRYGRILGKVFVNGSDVNLEMVASGFAWHYKQYELEQPAFDRRAYASAEERARGERLGLWRDSSPIPPWDFRRRRR